MPFAVTLLFDPATAGRLAAMRRAIADRIAAADPGQHEYPPHLTLGIYPDEVRVHEVQTALQRLAAQWHALPVRFSGFGIFPGPPPTLWAAPVVTPALLGRHAQLRAALSGITPHEHFEPDAWAPHVTLSATLADPAAALRVLLPLWQALSGYLEALQLVQFPPIVVLQTHILQPTSGSRLTETTDRSRGATTSG